MLLLSQIAPHSMKPKDLTMRIECFPFCAADVLKVIKQSLKATPQYPLSFFHLSGRNVCFQLPPSYLRAVSVSFWATLEFLDTEKESEPLFLSDSNFNSLRFFFSGGQLHCEVVTFAYLLPVGQWLLLFVTATTKSVTLFVNGKEEETAAITRRKFANHRD
jgi:hypothetical protein